MKKGTLNIFDIDGTLFNSDTAVHLKRNGKSTGKLSTSQFNQHKLKDDEEFDFHEFMSGAYFRKAIRPINKMLDKANRIIARQTGQSRSIIITARQDFKDHHEFLNAFRDHGFPIDQVYVERAGNMVRGQNATRKMRPKIAKGAVIRRYIKLGYYDRIRMWDDDPENLNILIKLGQIHPEVKVEAFLVDPDSGNTTRYGNIREEIYVPNVIHRTIRTTLRERLYK